MRVRILQTPISDRTRGHVEGWARGSDDEPIGGTLFPDLDVDLGHRQGKEHTYGPLQSIMLLPCINTSTSHLS